MADEEPDFRADFLAMSWQVPPALEMPPALFTPDEAPAAEVAADFLPHQFPPKPPPEVPPAADDEEELTHSELSGAVIRWHTPITHRVVCSSHPLAHTSHTQSCM